MTEDLPTRIKRHEGCVLKPYRDSLGFYTVGIGHRLTAYEMAAYKGGITKEEAEEIFQEDLAAAKAAVARALPWSRSMPPSIQDVLVEMCFQLGIMGLLKFRRFLDALRRSDLRQAVLEMLDSQWHRQTPGRCEELAALVMNGYPDEQA